MHPPSSSSSSAAAVAAGACLPRPSWRGGVLLIYLAVASALTTALLLHLPAPLAAATTSTATPITTSVPCASASQEASIQRYGVPAATAAATAAAAATTAASAATAAAAAGAGGSGGRRAQALTGTANRGELLLRGGWRSALQAGGSGAIDGGDGGGGVGSGWGSREHAAEQHMLRLADAAFKRNQQQRTAFLLERDEMQAQAQAQGQGQADDVEARLSALIPTFPCPSEQRLGIWGDGGKWVCAVSSAFQRHPVVYSIGSNAEFSFERDISLLLHTSPLTFDPFVPPDFAEHLNQTLDFLTFFSTGLSSQATLAQTRAQHPEQEFLTLAALMARHGHAYVDVLKLDCEGCEEDVLLDLATTTATRQLPRVEWQREEEEDVGVERRGGTKGLAAVGFVRGGGEGMVRDGEIDKVPPVGQILVEMHRVHNASATLPVVRQLESVGYRLFHSESNPYDPKTCMELAFIHRRLVLPPGR